MWLTKKCQFKIVLLLKKKYMKKFALILFSLCLLNLVSGQETNKTDLKPQKLSKLQIEVIQSDGYAYAEAGCRFDLSKMKLAKDKENKKLQTEQENNKLLLYEVMERGANKYKEISLNDIYKKAYNDGQIKLKTCIHSNKLRTQIEQESTSKK
jgi:hypothetical protein